MNLTTTTPSAGAHFRRILELRIIGSKTVEELAMASGMTLNDTLAVKAALESLEPVARW